MTFDPSGDWTIVDGLQAIGYQVRTDETTLALPVSVQALKREDNKRFTQTSDSNQLAVHSAVWEVWLDSGLAGIIPRSGDEFQATNISGNIPWTVMEVDYCTLTTRFRLTCEQQGQGS